MIYANPIVGRTGLGNMLFSWARAELFCKASGAAMLAPLWSNFFRIGPWLRREKHKRYYLSEFVSNPYVRGGRRWLALKCNEHYSENDIDKLDLKGGNAVVDFKGMRGFFAPFLEDQAYIKECLLKISSPDILNKVAESYDSEFIGVHLRRGDFIRAKMSVVDDWYVKALRQACVDAGAGNRKIQVFSDASKDELAFLADAFKDIVFMPKAPALHDMLLLSKAESIVCTSKSTFSMWAVFLGGMPSYWSDSEVPPPMGGFADRGVRIVSQ